MKGAWEASERSLSISLNVDENPGRGFIPQTRAMGRSHAGRQQGGGAGAPAMDWNRGPNMEQRQFLAMPLMRC